MISVGTIHTSQGQVYCQWVFGGGWEWVGVGSKWKKVAGLATHVQWLLLSN